MLLEINLITISFWTGSGLLILGLAALVAFARAIQGPTAFDRLLAINIIGTIAVLVVCLYGFFDGRPAFLDIALLYAFINFIATIAVLRFFRFGTLGEEGSAASKSRENDDIWGNLND
ncbi:MAG: hypothetical protein HAW65_01830 [Alphaproteobacteria bacterium]|nr:hypothetical protein [Alphaproteobacteria bacterium]MBE8220033.1 hypothetical protein [Alphaproteobacteria bacterium]